MRSGLGCGYAPSVNARTRVPLWVRALQRVDRIAWASYRAQEVVRDEVLIAWLDPTLRIGVRQAGDGRIGAHAWLEVGGHSIDPEAAEFVAFGAA